MARWAVLAVRAEKIRGEVRDRPVIAHFGLEEAPSEYSRVMSAYRRAEQMQESDRGTGGEQEWSCGESTRVSCARAEWTSAAERSGALGAQQVAPQRPRRASLGSGSPPHDRPRGRCLEKRLRQGVCGQVL